MEKIDKETINDLIKKAKEVSFNAYTPYSNFKVGAAVLTTKGFYTGCNVENASYGATICAERNAITTAVAQEGGKIKIRAICIYNQNQLPIPCGICLQVISEFATSDALVVLKTEKEEKIVGFADLFPYQFKLV